MDRVKWNDFMEILSDDLNRSGEYLINGFQDMVSDFITNEDATVGLSVTAQAVPDMSVYVKVGRLYQQGKQGTLEADSGKLTIAAAHESYARIDRIVAQYQEVEDRPETRNIMTDVVSRNIVQQTVKTRIAGTVVFQVLQGVPAAVPVPVTVPDGWIPLAKVNVPANVNQIQQSNIINDAPKLLAILNHNHNGAGGGQKISYKNLTDTPAIATQAEAEAQSNQNNKKFMTPLRVYQAIVAYFTQFLAAAVFTGIVKAVAPTAASNDNSVPTTSWVRTCFESMAKTVAEILEIQWKAEATGYLLLGPYLGNLKILWGKTAEIATGSAGAFHFPVNLSSICLITMTAPEGYSVNGNGGNIVGGKTSTNAVELFNWGPISAICKVIVVGV
ncbi:hypothetical protein [uncultured Phascolarctobacterium sp.]|uniref:hypothetical protein n=1 Tax=uncultured Phascolarctobacterium sp. TaxID=512296 RepID=UPI0026117869|nr:hypothetical protein [uncultured Phascolarctobacterium sp.]